MSHSALQPAQRDPDAHLLDRLRSGDEQAFMMLVRRYRPSMIRLAAGYVPSQAVAEEVVQEAWLGFLNGIGRFEGAVLRADVAFPYPDQPGQNDEHKGTPDDGCRRPDGRSRRIAFRRRGELGGAAAAVDRARGRSPACADKAKAIGAAMAELAVRQREVVTLRDVEGLSSEEVAAHWRSPRLTSACCCIAAGAISGRCSSPSSGGHDGACAYQPAATWSASMPWNS
jgi:RNA polymerase sigma-70 factor (ECF subfamily)